MSSTFSPEMEWIIRERYALYNGEGIEMEVWDFGRFVGLGVTWFEGDREYGYSTTLTIKDWDRLVEMAKEATSV